MTQGVGMEVSGVGVGVGGGRNVIRIWTKRTKDGTEMKGQNDQVPKMALV